MAASSELLERERETEKLISVVDVISFHAENSIVFPRMPLKY